MEIISLKHHCLELCWPDQEYNFILKIHFKNYFNHVLHIELLITSQCIFIYYIYLNIN